MRRVRFLFAPFVAPLMGSIDTSTAKAEYRLMRRIPPISTLRQHAGFLASGG
jgi:hypothetical protein